MPVIIAVIVGFILGSSKGEYQEPTPVEQAAFEAQLGSALETVFYMGGAFLLFSILMIGMLKCLKYFYRD